LNAPIVSAPPAIASELSRCVTVSVVSHGHGALVQRLLGQIAATGQGVVDRVILTHNLPAAPVQPPAGGWPFALSEVFNPRVAGFGANHNRAFALCTTSHFCVLNPDIELTDPTIWAGLLAVALQTGAGCVYPRLLNADHTPQDNERAAVTPLALLRRHLLGQTEARTDWVSAAFWLVASPAYRAVGGFDERYFMYCEDTDFCLRLRLAGHALARCDATAVHPASRSSRRNLKHLAWHLRSLLRLWCGPVLWRYLREVGR